MANNRTLFIMKKTITYAFVMFTVMIGLLSCSKSSNNPGSGGNTPQNGNVVFWQSESSRIITVTFRGVDKKITKYYPSYDPTCGSDGCANYYDVPAGNYSFHAENTWNYWNGDITVRAGECSMMHLSFNKASKKLYPSSDEEEMMINAEEDF